MDLKKWISLILTTLLLSGCGAEPVYETIGDVWANDEPVFAPAGIEFAAPEDAQMEVMEGDSGEKIYRIGDWELWTGTYTAGDLSATLEEVTGLQSGNLTVISRQVGNYACHETAWTTTGEDGTWVAQTAVIEDGGYHYALSMMVPQEDADQLGRFFTQVLGSVNLAYIDA